MLSVAPDVTANVPETKPPNPPAPVPIAPRSSTLSDVTPEGTVNVSVVVNVCVPPPPPPPAGPVAPCIP